MSTSSNGSRTASCALLILGLVAAESTQGQTRVEPVITMGGGYTEETQGGVTLSDTYANLGLAFSIPVDVASPRSRLAFNLGGSLARYSTESSLDGNDLALSLAYARLLSERSTFNLGVQGYNRTQRQLLPIDQSIESVRQRVEERGVAVSLGFSRRVTPRWSWSLNARASAARFENPFVDDTVPRQGEEREDGTASIGFSFAVSERTSVGPAYSYHLFRFADAEDRDSHALGIAVQHALEGRWLFAASVGAYSATGVDSTASDQTGPYANLQLHRSLDKLQYGATVRQNLDASDPFSGLSDFAAVNLYVGGGIGGERNRPTNWEFSAGLNRVRDLDTSTDLDSLTVGLAVGLRIFNQAALQVRTGWGRQLSTPEPREYFEGRIGISWFPFSYRRLGTLGRTREDPTVSQF